MLQACGSVLGGLPICETWDTYSIRRETWSGANDSLKASCWSVAYVKRTSSITLEAKHNLLTPVTVRKFSFAGAEWASSLEVRNNIATPMTLFIALIQRFFLSAASLGLMRSTSSVIKCSGKWHSQRQWPVALKLHYEHKRDLYTLHFCPVPTRVLCKRWESMWGSSIYEYVFCACAHPSCLSAFCFVFHGTQFQGWNDTFLREIGRRVLFLWRPLSAMRFFRSFPTMLLLTT